MLPFQLDGLSTLDVVRNEAQAEELLIVGDGDVKNQQEKLKADFFLIGTVHLLG